MWPHPEVFTFALVTLALVLAARGGHAAAVLAAALASLQNPPLVLLVALLWAAAALAAWRQRVGDARSPRHAGGAPGPAARGLLPVAVRRLQPLRAALRGGGEPLGPASPRPRRRPEPRPPPARAADPPARGGRRARRPAPEAGHAGAPRVRPSAASRLRVHREQQLEQRHVGAEPLRRLDAADSRLRGRGRARDGPLRPLGRAAAWVLGLALALQAAAVLVRGGPLAHSDFLEHSWAARLVLDHRPSLYRPAPEVFVERTLHHEGRSRGRSSTGTRAAGVARPGCRGAARRRSSPRAASRRARRRHACERTPGSARRSATGPTSTSERSREAPHLLRPELPPLARRQLAEVELPDAHAHELDDLVPDRRPHPPDLAVLPLGEDDLEPGRALALRPDGAAPRGVPRTRTFAGRVSVPSSSGRPSRRARSASPREAEDARVVGLRDVVLGVGEALAQAVVVRQDQQPRGVAVEPADREDPPARRRRGRRRRWAARRGPPGS